MKKPEKRVKLDRETEDLILDAFRWQGRYRDRVDRCRKRECIRANECRATKFHADPALTPCGTKWEKGEARQMFMLVFFEHYRVMTTIQRARRRPSELPEIDEMLARVEKRNAAKPSVR